MAYDVKFVKGLQAGYDALATKDAGTIYFVTDTPALYLGEKKFTSTTELTSAVSRITTNEGDIAKLKSALDGIDLNTKGSVKAAIDAVQSALDTRVGDITKLETSAKDNVVNAINELNTAVANNKTAGEVTLSTLATPTAGQAKTYQIKQGTNVVGVIDIPKDLVVTAGEIVEATAENPILEETSGEFIKLSIANQDDPIYINVNKLVDVYRPQENATQVQVSIISGIVGATIVRESITATELATDSVTTAKIANANVTEEKLASNSVTTAKIADKNVTKAKLDETVQATLNLADSSVQKIATGTTNGTISVTNAGKSAVEVAVAGLGSAAFTDSTAYDKAGDATTAETNAKAYTDTALTWGSF